MRLLTNNWIWTILFVWMEDLLLTVGPPCKRFILPWDGHTDIASAQKRRTPKISHRAFVHIKALRWAAQLSRLFLKKTRLEMILSGTEIAVKASSRGCGAAGSQELTSTQGEDQTHISSSGGGQEKSTAWDVSRPHSSDTSEFNSLPTLLCYCWFCGNNNFLTLWTCSAQTHQLKNRLRVPTKE